MFKERINSSENYDLGPFEIEGFEWEKYIMGYDSAISSLRMTLHKSNLNSLIFPIAYLYRHLFEIVIKSSIDKGNKILKNSKTIPGHHRLDELWMDLETLFPHLQIEEVEMWRELKVFFPHLQIKEKSNFFDEIKNMLNKFELFDKTASAFRYPIDKNGNLFFKNIKININDFLDEAHRLKMFLEFVNTNFPFIKK